MTRRWGRTPGRGASATLPRHLGRPSLLSVSPGVYAFGFLFMLPQLFVNYKVRPRPVHMLTHVLCAAGH